MTSCYDRRSLTADQIAEIRRLKAYFPFRLCYGALSHSGEFQLGSSTALAKSRSLVRKGFYVELLDVA